jgi:DNA-binding NarL/FixJ family response regulator
VQPQETITTPTSPSTEPGPLVLAVVEDLFFGIKIHEAAKRSGARMIFAKTQDAFWQKVGEQPALIVFDLNYSAMEPLSLLEQLQQRAPSLATVGYLPHVQEKLRRAAAAAGCQRVLPRSAFSTEVETLIRNAVAAVA